MVFKNDRQRRAAFASMSNKFSCAVPAVGCVPMRGHVINTGPRIVERNKSGLEIIGQVGEKVADGVVDIYPDHIGDGYGDGIDHTNAVTELWPDQNLEELLVGMTTAMYPDGSEGRVIDDRHYYVDVDRNRFSYAPVYAAGDIPLMGVDAIGTAGAATVSMVPLLTTLGIGYIGASMALKGKNNLEKEYRKGKKNDV